MRTILLYQVGQCTTCNIDIKASAQTLLGRWRRHPQRRTTPFSEKGQSCSFLGSMKRLSQAFPEYGLTTKSPEYSDLFTKILIHTEMLLPLQCADSDLQRW